MASCFWKYQASISGMAIFMISEGWMRMKPMLSQRRAPFETSPNSATPPAAARPPHRAAAPGASAAAAESAPPPHHHQRHGQVDELVVEAAPARRWSAPAGRGQRSSASMQQQRRVDRRGQALPPFAPRIRQSVILDLLLVSGAGPWAACRAGSSRAPGARSAPPTGRRSRRSPPARPARSSAVGRREGDEQGVVAQRSPPCRPRTSPPFRRYTCAVPVLPARDVFRAGKGARAGAFLVHADHRLLDHLDVGRLERQGAQRLRLDRTRSPVLMFSMCLTRCGRYITPLLAMAAVAWASWIGV
jgi:hypothetical protein